MEHSTNPRGLPRSRGCRFESCRRHQIYVCSSRMAARGEELPNWLKGKNGACFSMGTWRIKFRDLRVSPSREGVRSYDSELEFRRAVAELVSDPHKEVVRTYTPGEREEAEPIQHTDLDLPVPPS